MEYTPSTTELFRAFGAELPSRDALLTTVIEQQQRLSHNDEVMTSQRQQIALLEEKLRLLRAQRFGRSSEQSDAQQALFADDTPPPPSPTEPSPSPRKKPRRGNGKGFSASIPREEVYLRLSEEQKRGAHETFFVKIKEELDIEPAKVRVIEYWQEKAVFVDEDKQRRLVEAERPRHVLGKAAASVRLLAYLIIAKYCDALPLYRLEGILKRCGGSVTRTTLASWLIRLSVELQPLINLLREVQMSGDYIQGDETRLKVLKEPGMKATGHKWLWIMRGGPPDRPVVLLDYDKSRGKDVAAGLLESFEGRYFQSDGYSGYDGVCRRKGIVHLGCWDHARRKFVEAQKAQPAAKHKNTGPSKADQALSLINELYRIEREIDDLDADQKRHQRQLRSVPALNQLKDWLECHGPKLVKGGLTRNAIDYTLNQWPKLTRYCDDGHLRLSNILAENAIRPVALGRKAWLFSDTPAGARASATFFSLVETAKANGLEPFEYLHKVLQQLPYAETVEDMEALLPWNIK